MKVMVNITTTHHLAAVMLLGMLTWPSGPVGAQNAPAVGQFLVASRELRGSGFARSVVLIIQHGRDGTMGLIVNQPTATNAAELITEVPGLASYSSKLYVGGPVASWAVIMLVQSKRAPPDAVHVFGNVYSSGDMELLEAFVEAGQIDNDVRLYAGHAGWIPGQLEAEIERGSWLVIPARRELVFSPEPDGLWEELIGSGERLIVGID